VTEELFRACIEAIRRSGTVLAEAQQSLERIHRTLEQSRALDRELARRARLFGWVARRG